MFSNYVVWPILWLIRLILKPMFILSLIIKLLFLNSKWKKYKSKPESYPMEDRFRYVWKLCRTYLRMKNIRVVAKGKYELGQNGVIISNHKSEIDSLILIYLFGKKKYNLLINFLAKKELLQSKKLSKVFDLLEVITIDRASVRDRYDSIQKMSDSVRAGRTIVVFAEGTRISDRKTLGAYHDGAIRVGVKAFKPITPVLLKNTHLYMNKNRNPFKSRTVTVSILNPVHPKEVLSISESIAMNKIYKEITSEFGKLNKCEPVLVSDNLTKV